MDKNVFEKRAEELKRYKRIDETIFPEDQEEIRARSSRKPPYVAISWLEKFLDLNRRQKIDRVDKEFIRLNIVGSGNESKIVSALQFLGLIDEQGAATSKLASLRVLGDDFKKNLGLIVKEAYSDLISTILLDVAIPQNLVNFFVQRYNYTYSTNARSAARLFVWLASQAGIHVSDELQTLGSESYQPGKAKSDYVERDASRLRSRSMTEKIPIGEQRMIQATINIHLDKDTPREYWDRILALLGEKRRQVNEEP